MNHSDQSLQENDTEGQSNVEHTSEKVHAIEYWFSFSERNQAVEFVRIVPEDDFEVRISYCEMYEVWQAAVKKVMMFDHDIINMLEDDLSRRAVSVGGCGDGWGCKHCIS